MFIYNELYKEVNMSVKIQTQSHSTTHRRIHTQKRDFECIERLKKILLRILCAIFPCIKQKTHHKGKKMSYGIADTFGGYDTNFDYQSYYLKNCVCNEEKSTGYDIRFDKPLVSKKTIREGKIIGWEWNEKNGLWGLWQEEEYEKNVFSKFPKGTFFVQIEMHYDKEKRCFIDTLQILDKKGLMNLRNTNFLNPIAKVIKVMHFLYKEPKDSGVEVSTEERRSKRVPVIIKA